MIRELTDLLLPRECLVCGRQLGAREEQLCIWCAADLPLTYTWEQPHNIMADRFNATLERIRAPDEKMEYSYAASLLYYHRTPTSVSLRRLSTAGTLQRADGLPLFLARSSPGLLISRTWTR